jgi:hypothetical protein
VAKTNFTKLSWGPNPAFCVNLELLLDSGPGVCTKVALTLETKEEANVFLPRLPSYTAHRNPGADAVRAEIVVLF